MKVSNSVSGGSGGGTGLSDKQEVVLSHLNFNKETNRLEADVSLETLLNSFYLEGQYAISAGGTGLFLKNLSKHLTHYAAVGYLLDQEHVQNQGADGVVRTSAKVYGDTLITASLRGNVTTTTDTTPYAGISYLEEANVSLWGTAFRSGEVIPAGTVLSYSIWENTDSTGTRLFNQRHTVPQQVEIGDYYQMWWDHPAEALKGDAVYAELSRKTPSGSEILQVASLDTDDSSHWNVISFRTFENHLVATENHVLATKVELETNILGVKGDLEINILDTKSELETNVLTTKSELETNVLTTKGGLEFRMYDLNDADTLHTTNGQVLEYKDRGVIIWTP